MKKSLVLSLLLIFLSSFAFAGTINLPKTGQTKCWDTTGNEIPCPGTGQDGEIQAGVAWPAPRFADNGDGTMTDNLTGLMWPKNGNLPNNYIGWQQALDYVAGMNAGTYYNFGHTDWCLPNVNELESLINANEARPDIWLKNQGFEHVQPDGYLYWSSTTFASSTDYAWYVYMDSGYVYYGSKSGYSYAWPVRGGQCGSLDYSVICLPKTGQTKCYNTSGGEIPCAGTGQDGEIQAGVARPDPGFTDHGDGTITDNLTGLMWTKNANLLGGTTNWQQALDYANSLTLAGYSDWRLPNRKELYSLQDFSRNTPALPAGHPFANVQGVYYWSSTSYDRPGFANPPGYAWYFSVWYGAVHWGNTSYSYYVWPVRGGSFGPTVINLSSFTATPKAGEVIIEWTTASEIDNGGFNLYRAEAEDGEYVKINKSLIPGEGSPSSEATYQYIDKDVKNHSTYFYKLEDIDIYGTSTMHGPVGATPRLISGRSR